MLADVVAVEGGDELGWKVQKIAQDYPCGAVGSEVAMDDIVGCTVFGGETVKHVKGSQRQRLFSTLKRVERADERAGSRGELTGGDSQSAGQAPSPGWRRSEITDARAQAVLTAHLEAGKDVDFESAFEQACDLIENERL